MPIEPQEYHFKTQKTARYYVLEPEKPRFDLLAIHGYRQLGRNFVRRFEPLLALGGRIIVPEGLHRFYVEGYAGKVGASWMTKEDRASDIEDYIHYLSTLSDHLGLWDRPLHLLGFSQGGPTACRWLSSTDRPFASLILHSTVFPNDFDFEGQRDRLLSIPTFTVFGDDDFFAPESIIEEKLAWMEAKGLRPELIRFNGGHEIHTPSIEQILSNF